MDINSMSSGSSYSAKASSNKGMSGFSGMDTESMVEALLANTQSKIDKQNATKTQTEWKQEIYRDLISQINAFQKKFFNTSSSTSLMNQAFFNAMSAVSSMNALKVTATSSAPAGNTNIEVRQLATNTTMTSGEAVSGKLAGELDVDAIQKQIDSQINGDYNLKLEIGGEKVTVDLKDVFVDGGKFKDYNSTQEQADALTTKLNDALKSKGVTASIKDGNITFTGTDPKKSIRVESGTGAQALSALGVTAGTISRPDAGGKSTSFSGKIDLAPSLDFNLTLDDQFKDIKVDMRNVVDANGKFDATMFGAELEKTIDKAFGKDQVNVLMGTDANGKPTFELQVPTEGRKIMIGGEMEMLSAMGVKNGQSNRIGLGGTLKDLYFDKPLQGSNFRFNINGVDFSFTENDTIGEIINAVNTSDADVRIVYKAQDDKFVIQSSDTGAGREIKMNQTQGNLLTSMFGVEGGSSFTSGALYSTEMTGGAAYTTGFDDGGTFKLTVDGKEHEIKLEKKDTPYTQSELIDALNVKLEEKFGSTGGVANISLSLGTDKVTLKSKPGMSVSIAQSIPDTSKKETLDDLVKGGNLAVALGFGAKGANNAATGDTTVEQAGLGKLAGMKFTVNGSVVEIKADTKLSDLKTNTDGAFSFENGKLTVDGTKLPNTNGELVVGDADTTKLLFGTEKLTMGQTGTAAVEVKGQNAVVVIDGLETERSSNSFSVNGLNVELNATTGSYAKGELRADGKYYDSTGKLREDAKGIDGEGYLLDGVGADGKRIFDGEAAKIETTRNTDAIVDGVKGFVDEYNKLIKTINDLVDEDANYKKYPPLTESQKKEMSEKEITLWEEKAKQGLLRNDSTLQNFVQQMRTMIYEKPTGSSIAIYNLGIDTGSWDSKGQLVLSDDGEAQLRKMIESDSAAVLKLFTDPEEGLAVKLNELIDDTAKTSSGDPGALVQLAGVKGMASATQNTIYDRLKSIDARIETLKNTYEKEKARYWKQFNSMEQMISNMNSQSSWLSQQFA